MAGPWEKYQQQPDPIIAPADPYKQAAEQRAQQDQALQQQANARAEEAAARADRAEARAQRTEARQAQESALGTESERTAGFLSGRAKDAALRLAAAAKKDPSAQNPTLGVEMVRGVFGDTAANYLTDSERQQVRAAQIDIIDAGLTLGTGAAYTKEQLEGYREVYFPKLGDDEATIASKREALRSLLVNAQTKAGRAAPDIEEAIAALDALGQGGTGGGDWTIDDTVKKWGEAYYDENGNPLGPDGGGAFDKDGNYIGLVGSATYEGPNPEVSAAADRYEELDGKAGALQLARSGITFGLTDEASGIGQVIGKALTGDFNVSDNYQFGRDVRKELERRARERTGIAGTAAELVGAGGAIRTAGNAALNAARGLRAGGQAVNRAAIQGRMVRNATTEGAGAGALAGYGYGEGVEGSATNALLGGVTGGALGNVFQRTGNALANRGPTATPPPSGPTAAQRRLVEAGQRQGVAMRQPDVRPELRGRFRDLEQSETGGPMARAAIEADRDATEAAVRNIADGRPRGSFSLGNMAQDAINRTSDRMRGTAQRLYDRARKQIGNGVVPADNVVASIDQRIASLKTTGEGANAAEIKVLEGIKTDLQKSGLTIDSVQAQRKGLRDRISQNGGDPDRTEAGFMDLMTLMGDELEAGVRSALPNAADALKAANAAWAERAQFKQFIGKTFLGTRNAPVAPETAASRFMAMAKDKGDYTRFSKAFEQLEKSERDDFAATIAQGLGTKANGDFEYGKFLRDLNSMNPRALRDLFGKEGVSALRDLRDISRAKSGTLAAKNNSGSGGVVVAATNRFQQMIMTAFGGAAGGIPGAAAGAMATGAIEQFASKRAARLLLNPDFTKWLKQTPNTTNPKAINRHFERLDAIAARNPVLAADARALQEHLMQSFAQSPAPRLAAGEQEDPVRREPPQQ